MAAENLPVTISTDTTQAAESLRQARLVAADLELRLLTKRLAAVDLAMYAELVKAYWAVKTASDDQFETVAARYLTTLDLYALFTGRGKDDLGRELNRELG